MDFRKSRAGKGTVFGLLTLSGLLALGAPVAAVDAPTTYLWDSGGQMSTGRPGAWGNGATTLSRTVTYNGDDVLQISTRNFNEGVSFDFTPPVDLAAYQQNGYLRVRLRFRDAAPLAGISGAFPSGVPGEGAPTFGAPGAAGVMSAPQILPPRVNFQRDPRMGGNPRDPRMGGGDPRDPRMGGGSSGGSGSGSGVPGAEGGLPGGLGLPMGPPPQETQIRRLQWTFVLERGVSSGFIDIPADLEKIKPDENGWRLFLLPVKELRATPNAQGMAQRLILTSDKEDTFYLAQAALVVESGQMLVSIRLPSQPHGTQRAELDAKPGLVTLVADVEAGTADPLVEWNFDADNVNPDLRPPPAAPVGGETVPAGPEGLPVGGAPLPGTPGAPGAEGVPGAVPEVPVGPRVDARGLVAKFEYPNEEQDYRVEVTVTDRAGKKAPVKASILIHVRG